MQPVGERETPFMRMPRQESNLDLPLRRRAARQPTIGLVMRDSSELDARGPVADTSGFGGIMGALGSELVCCPNAMAG
jgi:hypothetical protein